MQINIRPVPAPTLTNLAAASGIRAVTLSWTIPNDSTYRATEIWRSPTTNIASATKLAEVTSNSYTMVGIPTQEYTYWVRAINVYGRADGAWSTGVTVASQLTTALDLADSAVTAAKLNVAAINSLGQLATGSVGSTQIASGAVGSTQIANGAVGSTQIANGAVGSTQIAPNAVTAAAIANGAVSELALAAGAVTASRLAVAAISSTTGNLNANTVTASQIQAGSITGDRIAAATIAGDRIAARTIGAGNIVAGSLTSTEIQAGGITADRIAAGSITATQIAANTITATQISSAYVYAGAINASQITAGSISADRIAAGTITGTHISSSYVYAGAISASQITTGTLSAERIGAGKAEFRAVSNPPASVIVGGDGSSSSTPIFSLTRTASTFLSPLYVNDLYGSLGSDVVSISSAASRSLSSTSTLEAGSFSDGGSSSANLRRAVLRVKGYRNEGQLVVSGHTGPTSPHAGRFYGGVTSSFNYESGSNLVSYVNTSGIAGSASTYSFYSEKGTMSPFTGAHDGLISKTEHPEEGDILVDLDVIERNGVNDTITEVTRSTQPYQVAIGIMSGRWGLEKMVPAAFRDDSNVITTEAQWNETTQSFDEPQVEGFGYKLSYALCKTQFDTLAVNSLGEGQINVCGENGTINKGDLIVTSSMSGKGMRQGAHVDEDGVTYGSKQICTWSVARARETVTFDSPTQVKMISCIYLCG